MKKIIVLICAVCLIVTGCGKEETKKETSKPSKSTPASVLTASFEKEISKSTDLNEIADKLMENEVITTKLMKEENAEYLPGFSDVLNNYKTSIKIQPVISTIPFIMYLFESDNPEELAKELQEKCDIRWNVCVEADEMKYSVKDNYVFFIMAPSEFEE